MDRNSYSANREMKIESDARAEAAARLAVTHRAVGIARNALAAQRAERSRRSVIVVVLAVADVLAVGNLLAQVVA